jgi:hypothetical protein
MTEQDKRNIETACHMYQVMNSTQITDVRTALLCARLNLHSGKRHLKKGYSAAGVVKLYDAVLFGMRYYITRHKRCASFMKNIDLWDATGLFYGLARAGVFDDLQAFNRFSLLVERALWQKACSFDTEFILTEVEQMLMKLGVIPS